VAAAWARILSAAMRRPLPALVVVAALLTGCGGGGDTKKNEGVRNKDTVTVGHNQPIALGASEYKFEPKNVIVNSGTTQATVVRFVMRNNGSLAHDLHVQKDGQDLGGTPIFGPGKTEPGQATLAPGTYEFICTVGDHAALGMKGTLTVTSKKTTRPKDPDAGKPGEKDRGHIGGQG
jgi:plastocyanin